MLDLLGILDRLQHLMSDEVQRYKEDAFSVYEASAGDVPALLSEVQSLRAQLKTLNDALEEVKHLGDSEIGSHGGSNAWASNLLNAADAAGIIARSSR